MKRFLAMGLVVVAWVLASGSAEALPSTCFTPPLPTIVQSPTFSVDVFNAGNAGRFDVWRQACEDGSGELAVLVRVTPISSKLFVCSTDFSITQNGVLIPGRVTTTTSAASAPPFCDNVTAPTTLLLFEAPGPVEFRERASFTLDFVGSFAISLPVPAPTVVVTSTGCTSCGVGDVLGFTVRVTNGGPAITVELKVGIRLPDGRVISLFDGRPVLGAGSTSDVVIVPPTPTPASVPPGTYIVEAAVLEPGLGINWTRSSVRLTIR